MPPAARLTDMHTCPMVTGVVPHVGGPIIGPGVPMMQVFSVGDGHSRHSLTRAAVVP